MDASRDGGGSGDNIAAESIERQYNCNIILVSAVSNPFIQLIPSLCQTILVPYAWSGSDREIVPPNHKICRLSFHYNAAGSQPLCAFQELLQ